MSLEKDINKALRRLLEIEDLEEVNVTGNLDGGEGPISTPNAFAKSKDEDDLDGDHIEVFDYKRVKENKSLYAKMMNQSHLSEANYRDYKRDESMNSKQKVNKAIEEINRKLFEVEHIMRQNIRLKTEAGVDSGQYWQGTRQKMGKISERILKIAKQFRDLSA